MTNLAEELCFLLEWQAYRLLDEALGQRAEREDPLVGGSPPAAAAGRRLHTIAQAIEANEEVRMFLSEADGWWHLRVIIADDPDRAEREFLEKALHMLDEANTYHEGIDPRRWIARWARGVDVAAGNTMPGTGPP